MQVNKYDTEGNLKSSDIDSTSWEDRDTQSYEWSNKQEPPPEAFAPPPSDDRIEQFFATAEQQPQQQQGTGGDQSALVLTTAERRDVPAVSWSGSSATHQVKHLYLDLFRLRSRSPSSCHSIGRQDFSADCNHSLATLRTPADSHLL